MLVSSFPLFKAETHIILVPTMTFPVNQMKYTRKYKRYPTHREARYFFGDTTGDKQVCTIINVSRKGMGIIFHTDEKINIDTILIIEIPLTHSSESISVKGALRWVDRMEIDIIGGIELLNELSDVQLSRLDRSRS